MKAKNIQLNATDKVSLYEHVPLSTPFVLAIEPSGLCNLKCGFCVHSLPVGFGNGARGHARVLMSEIIFEKIIMDLKEFDEPLKLIYFSQIGEPLLNARLPDMIRRFNTEKLTNRTAIFTNAIPLTEEKSLALVDAGLSSIKISINGLSSEDYIKNCGTPIDFDRLVNQITYLYNNRKNLVTQIKILDKLLNHGDEKRFYNIFGDICDQINVEKLFPVFDGVDYDNLYFHGEARPVSRFESARNDVKICALPFYRMAVAADGMVSLCYTDVVDRNIRESSLKEIWNGEKRKSLLINLLQQKYEGISEMCNVCACGHEQASEKDDLYPYRNKILARLRQSF